MAAASGAGSPGHRYVALDALRGICALCVCLFHFQANGPIATSAFVRGSWLFVDFFFVLSGFVMACSWGGRLSHPREAQRFMVLRFGRVYPLHITMLLAFLATELLGVGLSSLDLMNRQAFNAEHSPEAWLLSAGLAQIFGLLPGLSWNHPSWSIAAEFWTYLLFAAAMLLSGRRAGPVLLLAAVASAAWLALVSPTGINVTYEFSLWRCVYGFAIGALIWRWTVAGRHPVGGTGAELIMLGLVVLFVCNLNAAPWNLLAPLLFGITVHVFAAQSGRVSRLLAGNWAQRLGLWSYSIYMVHAFVQSRLDDVLRLAKAFGAPEMTVRREIAGRTVDVIGTSPIMGVAFTLVMLALVIGLSAFTYWAVELPGQRWAKARAERLASC